jgi:hypothetical protein
LTHSQDVTPIRLALLLTLASVALATPAVADETDNFTCRRWVLHDALPELDRLMNARIAAAVARANAGQRCDAACMRDLLIKEVGGSERHTWTGIPHARFVRQLDKAAAIDRCRLRFSESVYGARRYNRAWLFPFTHRVIYLADAIRLDGELVGLDKINHFIREGLSHWRAVQAGATIEDELARELGPPGRQLRWNEYGLKGWSLTGVLSYADLAAGFSGFRFFTDLLAVDGDHALVSYDAASAQYVQTSPFTFAGYVNASWDEAINPSTFQPALAREVAAAVARLGPAAEVRPCGTLGQLPLAVLYVNPVCLALPSSRSLSSALIDVD